MRTLEKLTNVIKQIGLDAKTLQTNLYDHEYVLSYKNDEDLEQAMEKIREAATRRNFGYRWGEKNAYAELFSSEFELIFHAPKAQNGDTNYWDYKSGNMGYEIGMRFEELK